MAVQNYNLPRRNSDSMIPRELKRTIPKPNIVRIELLAGFARQRYLGTAQGAGDIQKSVVHETIAPKSDRIFYGFLKAGHQQQFGIDANWNIPGGTAPSLNHFAELSAKGANKVAQAGEESKSRATRTATKVPKAVVGAVSGVGDLGRLLSGVTSVDTGSTNLKRYGGSELKGFNVTCTWYLPEQYRICMKSLQVLTRMSYPLQVHESDWKKAQRRLATLSSEKYAEYITGEKAENPNLPPPQVVPGVINTIIEAGTEFKHLFRKISGGNLTFDPIPVRVCIGHYVDVEPLVIETVTMAFSDETFVLEDETEGFTGRHVPIMCEATIKFKYWLNPAPKLGFTTLIGEEMFGQDIEKFDEANGKIR